MEGRRSQRIIACVPLGIQPVVPAGEAETAVINLHGALIATPAEWPVGTVLKITNRQTNHEIGGRVTWSGPQDSAGKFKVGIEFDMAVKDFWGTSYDPESEMHPSTLEMMEFLYCSCALGHAFSPKRKFN